MNNLRKLAVALGLVAGGVVLGVAVMWSLGYMPHREASPPPGLPASMPKILKESQINVITLTPEAMQRLALRSAPVERKTVRITRFYGGEAMIPIGQAITVSAPLAGVLKPAQETLPMPGQTVKKGQTILHLLPLVPPEGLVNLTTAKVDADGQVESAQTQVRSAKIALDRATRLLQSEAGSKKAVDDAQAQFDLAQKTLDAATARQAILRRVVGDLDKGVAGPLAIESPSDGLLRILTVSPGQMVPGGAPLFEVVDLGRVWIRVPVYAGDVEDIDPKQPARVTSLTAQANEKGEIARRTAAPPAADPAAGTVDFFYELDNRKTNYSPGQRVGVALKQTGEDESLTVPWSAVIHDIYGGTWVYEQVDDRQFARKRVVVRFVTDGTAVLASGPAVGARVVVAGAAELFGAETGFSK